MKQNKRPWAGVGWLIHKCFLNAGQCVDETHYMRGAHIELN